jgi:ribonuclease HII
LLQFERQAWEQGHRRLAGVDEAGRGPLAGPVVAAALVFERDFLEDEQYGLLKGVNDSKRLSVTQREDLYGFLTGSSRVSFAVGVASVQEIDDRNILRATHLAMGRALAGVKPASDFALVDGLPVSGLPCASLAVIEGDARSLSIAAASIIAKVTRDRMMVDLDRVYPQYGFSRHKGYGTKAHLHALLHYGPCPEHRRSFRPIREVIRMRAAGGGVTPAGANDLS